MTNDHVPPKCFFPDPRPSNLVTVPACRACNQKGSHDEEFFLVSLMFSDAGVKEAGKALWKRRLGRMLFRNRGVRWAIRKRMELIHLRSPSGLYLGKRYGLEIDYGRLDSVVLKIVRGLYFAEYGEALPVEATVNCNWINTEWLAEDTKPHLSAIVPGKHRWPGIFEYECARVPEAPDKSVWLLMFFDYAAWWAIIGIWNESG